MIEPFYIALGKFILTYSHAENLVKEVAAFFGGMSPEVGRAMFSDQRLRTIIKAIRKIHEAQGKEVHPRIEEALTQFATINDMRDKLLHQGFEYDEELGLFYTTNLGVAHSEERIKTLPVSIETLEQMTGDLAKIQASFMFWGHPFGDTEPMKTALVSVGQRPQIPWLYKSPSPIPRPDKIHKGHQKRSPPPSASGA